MHSLGKNTIFRSGWELGIQGRLNIVLDVLKADKVLIELVISNEEPVEAGED